MALHRLDNSAWGFESNCFVCEPANRQGLRIPFLFDDQARLVLAEYQLDAAFSGIPSRVHGGVTVAVLDEAMAWAAIADAEVFAVTRSINARFLRPIEVGDRCQVEARLTGEKEAPVVRASGVVRNPAGEPCVKADAELAVMSALEPFWST